MAFKRKTHRGSVLSAVIFMTSTCHLSLGDRVEFPLPASSPVASHFPLGPPNIFHAINNNRASYLQIQCCLTGLSDVCIPTASARTCNYPWVSFPEGISGSKAMVPPQTSLLWANSHIFQREKGKKLKERQCYSFNDSTELHFFLGILLKVPSSWKCGWWSRYFVKSKRKREQIGSLITLKPYVQHMSAVTEGFRKNNYKTSASDFKGVLKGPKFGSLNFGPLGKSLGGFRALFFPPLCLLWIVLLQKTKQTSLPYKRNPISAGFLPGTLQIPAHTESIFSQATALF